MPTPESLNRYHAEAIATARRYTPGALLAQPLADIEANIRAQVSKSHKLVAVEDDKDFVKVPRAEIENLQREARVVREMQPGGSQGRAFAKDILDQTTRWLGSPTDDTPEAKP